MWRWFLLISRPFGVALALVIIINLFLALKSDRLPATRLWLDLTLPEPWLSVFASLLGFALIVPHALGRWTGLRIVLGGIGSGFLLLAGANVIGYYHSLRSAEIRSHAAFPFSLIVATVLVLEISRLACWGPVQLKLPRPARIFFGGLLAVAAYFVLTLAHIYTFGMTDYSEALPQADAVVVLGARVYPDGRLSDALRIRLDKAISLYKRRKTQVLIHSGGVDEHGVSEPEMMRRYAIAQGVQPQHNVLDPEGADTHRSALSCARIAREKGFSSFYLVSQYFHLARAKLSFERAGAASWTVPALGEGIDPRNDGRLQTDVWPLLREVLLAYPYYLVWRQ